MSRSRLGLVRLVVNLAKALFSQVGVQVQVSQDKDQVGQGQGQELDNMSVILKAPAGNPKQI